MSNFPLLYRLAWLPHFVRPSHDGDISGFAQPAARLMAPPPRRSVGLVFLGDISAVASREAPELDPALTAILSAADLVVGNCESPVVTRRRSSLMTRLGLHHAMDAGFLLGLLTAMKVDADRLVLSLANNHALDQGTEGLAETRTSLDRLGIRTLGTTDDAPMTTLSLDGVVVGLIGFTDWRNAGKRAFARRIVMTGRLAHNGWQNVCGAHADLVCALPHWDWEFCHIPRATTRALARRLAAQGVGLVAGHHAHVVQPVERIGDTLVAYGLGDFLGSVFPRQPWPGRIGAMLTVEVSADASSRGRIAAYKMVPFMRLSERARERLVPVESLHGPLEGRVDERLGRVLGYRSLTDVAPAEWPQSS